MCQEIHLSDIRSALLDYCEEIEGDVRQVRADDLLHEFDESEVDRYVHAFDHSLRASQLAAVGDTDASAIHHALCVNMARAAIQ